MSGDSVRITRHPERALGPPPFGASPNTFFLERGAEPSTLAELIFRPVDSALSFPI